LGFGEGEPHFSPEEAFVVFAPDTAHGGAAVAPGVGGVVGEVIHGDPFVRGGKEIWKLVMRKAEFVIVMNTRGMGMKKEPELGLFVGDMRRWIRLRLPLIYSSANLLNVKNL
jgi:hypothetical protein